MKKSLSLDMKAKERNLSKKYKRFFTKLDMAIIKKDAATRNSEIKRGIVKKYPNNTIYPCSCGNEGCFIHTGWENREPVKPLKKRLNKPITKKSDYKIDWKSKEFLQNYLKNKEQ